MVTQLDSLTGKARLVSGYALNLLLDKYHVAWDSPLLPRREPLLFLVAVVTPWPLSHSTTMPSCSHTHCKDPRALQER